MPVVHWLGIHKNLLVNDNKTNIEPGLLTIRNLSIEDSGIYECIAENDYGKISQFITLQVQGKFCNKISYNYIIIYLMVCLAIL